jgi:uncharacterized protein with von Willebrand factor type A (vWA) domain
LPSLTLDKQELLKVHAVNKKINLLHKVSFYEQRQLYNLLMLKNPKVRVIFLSSMPIDEAIVQYYWKFCSSSVSLEDFQSRLSLISPMDSRSISLVEKILSRPLLVQKMKKLNRNSERTCLVCSVSSEYEVKLCEQLDCLLLGFDPKQNYFGTKDGSKKIFRMAKIPFPESSPLCKNEISFYEETIDLIERNEKVSMLVVKLNDSFSGKGNAIMELRHLREFMKKNKERNKIIEELKEECSRLTFSADTNWESFRKRINDMGVISEVFVDSVECPSGQGYVENGKITMVSTHDQVSFILTNHLILDSRRRGLHWMCISMQRKISRKSERIHFKNR